MNKILKNTAISLTLLLLITSLYSCNKDRDAEPIKNNTSISDLMASMNIQEVTKPVVAPDFELLSINGRKVSLSQHSGKVILLNFWTTW